MLLLGRRDPTALRDEIVAALFADNMGRFLAGEALVALVDRSRGY